MIYINNDLGNKQPKGNYASATHSHDDRYYTESEINSKLDNYIPLSYADNSADDLNALLKTKVDLIYSKSEGGYFIRGGWQGKQYGYTIGQKGGDCAIATFISGSNFATGVRNGNSYSYYNHFKKFNLSGTTLTITD